MTSQRKAILRDFRDRNNLQINNLELLGIALTHKSWANEQTAEREAPDVSSFNQRLEFLGDAVLGLVIAKALYDKYRDQDEGFLTRMKSQAVCEATLADLGNTLGLGDLLIMGKGELAGGGNTRPSNIADATEAILGAIFEDAGFEAVEAIILRLWQPYLEREKTATASIDYKSRLQEWLVKKSQMLPEYRVIDTHGPEHARIYQIGLFIQYELKASGKAGSKKRAEQEAARIYLEKNAAHVLEYSD